ncbi:MAG: hypothetical protein QM831_03300 [Kofleriaceae bacterium]
MAVRNVARSDAVWPASAVGVWHASDPDVPMIDQSVHHHDASVIAGDTAPGITDGIVGQARVFDGIKNRLCSTDSDGSMIFGTHSFSFETWVYVDHSHAGSDRPFTHGGAVATDVGFDFELGTSFWVPHLADGTTLVEPVQFQETLGRWVHLVAVVDREAGQLELYAQGVLVTMGTIPVGFGSIDEDRPICFSSEAQPFVGKLDEPRVYSEPLDPAWIAATYNNLANRSAFITIGGQTAISL